MATFNSPYIEPGLAAFDVLDDYATTIGLVSGSHPKLASTVLPVGASAELAQFAVVGLDSNGRIVPATWNADPANAIQAIGVVTQAVTGAADGSTTVAVFYSGHLNPDALVWHSSFDTEGKKMGAFNGAPTPTTIVLRKRQH